MRKRNRKVNNKLDNYRLRADLHVSRDKAVLTLNRIKQKTQSDKLFDLYRDVITKNILDSLFNGMISQGVSDIIKNDSKMVDADIANEIIWAASTAILYKEELKTFLSLSEGIEDALLTDDSIKYDQILNNINDKFGWSYWLMENKIASVQHWHGNEAKRELVKELRSLSAPNNLVDLIIYFLGRRVEDTSVPGYLEGELAKLFKNQKNKSVFDYVRTKLFDSNSLTIDQASLLLRVDFKSGFIDSYESLISVLRWVISNEEILLNLKNVLKKPIQVLFNALKDKRLVPIMIAFDSEIDVAIDEKRELIIEEYTAGNYEVVIELVNDFLLIANNSTDISILLLGLKAELRATKKIEPIGLLKELGEHLRAVLKFDENSYSAALFLNSLNDRFINHSWSSFLKIAVMDELSSQAYNTPLDFQSDLYARETRISPFSFLLSSNKDYVIQSIDKFSAGKYLRTNQLLELTLTGKVRNRNGSYNLSKERYYKYLGRFYLVNNDYSNAIESFEKAMSLSSDSNSLKYISAIITALVRMGDLDSAVKTFVEAYLTWGSTPTALPLPEIIQHLDEPENWPSTICLPIVLALYTNLYNTSKLSHVRYSFEMYNMNNGLHLPQDLYHSIGKIKKEYVTLYLQMVWRPEIMGQTLLYEGSKEIEEARIQVCKVLIDIDQENASDYQTEIRERVKAIELAKVTKLVDQSRVYVDVSAIKKNLKSQLGDVYAKYKTTMHPVEKNSSEIVEALADAFGGLETSSTSLTQLMSNMHLVGEEDMQFAAMYSQIVNAFLLGEHGLNAYLSTRVRHGKFSNAIRKPIVDENLVTEMLEGTGNYTKNLYWSERLTELNDSESENVLALLESFGSKIDAIISYVRDELIQVSIIEDLNTKTGNGCELFVYRTSNVERMYARSKLNSIDNIDEFIDICVDILWEKTDDNLIKVKELILGQVKTSILTAFDKLNESLGRLGYTDRLGELQNHIARAKTNIQHQISNVSTWFTRNEVYDRSDYTIDFPILIAKTMVSNLISGADAWEGIRIKGSDHVTYMPGRTLDGMVDLYCASFENAIEHSGLPINEIEIIVDATYKDKKFEVTITNNINAECYNEELEGKIEAIRKEINKKDTRSKAQKERGSGFHKMWSTINSPLYKEPKLSFGYKERHSFEVIIQFNIEVTDEQNFNS